MKTRIEALSEIVRAERDEGFREEMTRLGVVGLRAGSSMAVLIVVMFVAVYAALGRLPAWAGSDTWTKVVYMEDKLFIVAISGLTWFVAGRLTLNGLRILAGLVVILICEASICDDLIGGVTSFSPAWITFGFLLAAALVPFRPEQTFFLGIVLILMLYLTVEYAPAILNVPPVPQTRGHYVYMAPVVICFTGITWIIYHTRYRFYRSREEAEHLTKRMMEMETARGRFYANISHEFRTPLTLMLGPIGDALGGAHGALDPSLRHRMAVMEQQGKRLQRLIDQLLDLAKLESGRMALHAAPHDLITFIRRQAVQFHSLAERKKIHYVYPGDRDRLEVWFDGERLQDALSNLLSNAFKFTPEEGSIRILVKTVTRDGISYAVVSVRDSGRGIAPESLPRVFDRFYGASETGTFQASTGIGLALVREIAERHYGCVDVSSEPGFGSEFSLYLRLGSAHIPPEDRVATTEAEIPHQEAADLSVDDSLPTNTQVQLGDTILVVDDEDAVREYLVEILKQRYTVLSARDGKEGLKIVGNAQPALVVSDVMMPVMDGLAFCRKLKDARETASIPVVLLTARSEDEARLEGYRAGADAYLAKPFSSAELLVLTENLIAVRRLLRERAEQYPRATTSVTDGNGRASERTSEQEAFLGRVQEIVVQHFDNLEFGVEWLAGEVGLSTRQLQRRISESTHLTAAGLIRTMRLEAAAQILRDRNTTIGEVARSVGYEDADYFSRLFRQAYGVSPSEYAKERTGQTA